MMEGRSIRDHTTPVYCYHETDTMHWVVVDDEGHKHTYDDLQAAEAKFRSLCRDWWSGLKE